MRCGGSGGGGEGGYNCAVVHFVTAVCAAAFSGEIAVRFARAKMSDIRQDDSEI